MVRSISGRYEGRTTGSRSPCRSATCTGWFVGVLWETGQQMYLCSEGWDFDPTTLTVQIVCGGEISARFINPVDPAPREEWPTRAELAYRAGWRAASADEP